MTHDVEKILRSAIANAEQKSENLDVDELVVSRAFVNEGPRQKRIRPAPMGRAYRYQRRTSSHHGGGGSAGELEVAARSARLAKFGAEHSEQAK